MKIKVQEITSKDILAHWGQGKASLDWRPLTIREKREWLKACLFWSGLPRQRIPAGNYIIDANQVAIELDFYCILGETFFGYRGYFGQDFHGFNDCFSEIAIYQKTRTTVEQGAKLIVKNSGHLKEILKYDIFSEIIKAFSGHGFAVDFDLT